MAGGHSVDDNEPKYGLAVTGVVHPGRILTNCGLQEGDVLILTKPLGAGVLFNACRSGKLPYRELESILPEVASLNGKAMEIALKYDVHSCTDVTGFGIAGHSLEMARGSCMQVTIDYRALPRYPHALRMYQKGQTTGSNKANRKMSEGYLEIRTRLTREEEEMLFDPQTSGGLLISLLGSQADELLGELHGAGIVSAAIIGSVSAGEFGVKIV
jgi:selenide,water dikinase